MTEKIKVLMVDDEERFRITTAKILERKGFQTILAASGEEALEKIREKPDVVVLDIRMTGMDGEETLVKIKESNPEIPVIMLTGHGERPSAERALEYGAFDYLAKPADIDLLTYKINEAILFGGGIKKDQEMVVGEVMIPIGEYVVLGPDATLQEAIIKIRDAGQLTEGTEKLMQTGHQEVLVVDKDGIVGMVSIKEIIDAARPPYLNQIRSHDAGVTLRYSHIFWNGMLTMRLKEIAGVKLINVMTPPPPPVDINANFMEVCDLMHETSARRLIVTDGKKVVGVIREQELFYEIVRILTK
jgi:CheY-like chemotaxis protein